MTTTNDIFSDSQRDLLTAALNRIVPATGEMPAAGDLGVAAFVESVASETTVRRRLFLDGLVRIELAASERGGSFQSLSPETQTDALRAVESGTPEFFQQLVTQTYRGYYTNERVMELLSYRVPNREDYNPLPFDESLLEPVRQRGQKWVPTNN